MTHQCDVCRDIFSGRTFSRRNFPSKNFCSISCVEAFEIRIGLPNGRIYESRPGWSRFPAVQTPHPALPC